MGDFFFSDAKVSLHIFILNLIRDCLCIVFKLREPFFLRTQKMKSNSFSHSVEDKKSNKSKVAERRMNEIYKGICQHRQFLEDLLRHNSLPTDLKSHLYLLLTAPTKSSSSTILASLKSHYSDDIMKALMNAIDSKAIKLNSSCADDALCERLDEVFAPVINY